MSRWVLATVAILQPAIHLAAGQFEVATSPASVTLEAPRPTVIRLGILAINGLVAPAINGRRLAAELPIGSVLVLRPDGTAVFAYSDLFLRNFRAREQLAGRPDEQRAVGLRGGIEDLLRLPAGAPKPKVLLDIHKLDVRNLHFNRHEDILWWTGELTYKFDLGLPVKAFRLASLDGRRKTTIGDWEWEKVGRAVTILASSDGETWTEVWRSHGKGGRREVEAKLPPSLLGRRVVYLKFHGQGNNVLFDLHVSAELDATALAPVLELGAGANRLEFTDAAASSHSAVLFWEGEGVRASVLPVEHRRYPRLRPRVIEGDEAVTVLFPQRVGIAFQRRGKAIAGIRSLFVRQRDVLSAAHNAAIPAPSLEVLSDHEVGGVTDWAAYLKEREANKGKWPRRGGREVRTLGLDGCEYLGCRVGWRSVTVRTRVRDGEETAELDWILSPVRMRLGGRRYRGLGWKVRLKGLEGAAWLRIVEPAAVRYGDWAFEQVWGNFIEGRLDFVSPFAVPWRWYFGNAQPFFFVGGPGGAVASFFDRPVCAQVAVAEEAGRLLVTSRVPLGAGSARETPTKYWLWTDDAFPTRWAALDEWTSVFDAVAGHYNRQLGLRVTEPKPTLLWQTAGDHYTHYKQRGRPKPEESWLHEFARNELPRAAELGLRVIYISGPWDCDSQYPRERYLPGSKCFGSTCAPWRLEIGEAIGGEAALKELCDRAHKLGVKIVLWSTPAHLSNSSPLLCEHPEWIAWRRDGTPDTFGYADITGTSLRSGYYPYAVGRYRKIRQATGFDGLWQDSLCTFGILSDYRERQPRPQLDRTLAMQRELWRMGCTEIHIEACGPLGLSSGGYGMGKPELSEHIRGREYGLYRTVADALVEPESYYRALASKGVIGLTRLDVLDKLPEAQRARIVQANRDYVRVMDKMERRRLIADGDTWQGVAWTRRGSREELLFAFTRFRYPLAGRATVEDVTAGTTTAARAAIETTPVHTYVIRHRR